jgi:hypothetical protein
MRANLVKAILVRAILVSVPSAVQCRSDEGYSGVCVPLWRVLAFCCHSGELHSAQCHLYDCHSVKHLSCSCHSTITLLSVIPISAILFKVI